MRVPKYRAWLKDKHKMADVYCMAVIEGNPYIISYGNNPYSWYEIELMEFTGLKDKNGKEIYEGDLVKFFDEDNEVHVYPVVWYNDGACFGVQFDDGNIPTEFPYLEEWYCELNKLEVVGNIYENKDLLGE